MAVGLGDEVGAAELLAEAVEDEKGGGAGEASALIGGPDGKPVEAAERARLVPIGKGVIPPGGDDPGGVVGAGPSVIGIRSRSGDEVAALKSLARVMAEFLVKQVIGDLEERFRITLDVGPEGDIGRGHEAGAKAGREGRRRQIRKGIGDHDESLPGIAAHSERT